MKKMQACVGLVLTMVLGVLVGAATDVAAVSGADVTKSQLDAAIVQAEQALAKDMSSKFDGDKVYLQKLVDQAKEFTVDFAANAHKNLGELVAALSEGAQVLIIRANADAASNQVVSAAQVETYVATPAVYTTAGTLSGTSAQIRLTSYTMESNQVAGVISEENRLKLEAQSQGNSYGGYTSGNRGTTTSNSNKGDVQNEKPESYDTEVDDGEIEVPQTGGGVESAKPSGVGIGLIIAGAALFAGASAMALARKAKRN